jgi:hypothetical protein
MEMRIFKVRLDYTRGSMTANYLIATESLTNLEQDDPHLFSVASNYEGMASPQELLAFITRYNLNKEDVQKDGKDKDVLASLYRHCIGNIRARLLKHYLMLHIDKDIYLNGVVSRPLVSIAK